MKALIRILAGLCGIALMAYAILAVLVFGYADFALRKGTPGDLDRAAQIAPANADVHARLALADPGRTADLAAALALNPDDPTLWSMRAIEQEQAGDISGAEQSLRRGTQIANYFLPWWSLASFYYRQANEKAFLEAAKHAMALGDMDPVSLFQMAENLKIPNEVFEKDILPARASTVLTWMARARDLNDFDSARWGALRLIELNDRRYTTNLIDLCDTLLHMGRVSDAVELWNHLASARWIDFATLDPAAGHALTDGDFRLAGIQTAFDWRVPGCAGVSALRPGGSGIRFDFSGNEAETCELLVQFVPVAAGRHYRLTSHYRTKGIGKPSGLTWSLRTGSGAIARSSTLEGEAGTFDFQAPAQPGVTRLVLDYERPRGMVVITGRLELESVRLELVPGGSR